MGKIHADYETYSEAGFRYDESMCKWRPLEGARLTGIFTVGAYNYADHHTTTVEEFCFTGRDGKIKHWRPGSSIDMEVELFSRLRSGEFVLYCLNSFFEMSIWDRVCHRKYGWPKAEVEWFRDTAANARYFSLPGSLEKASMVVNGETEKDKLGSDVMKMLMVPKNPKAKDPRKRWRREDNSEIKHKVSGHMISEKNMWTVLDLYCEKDVIAEKNVLDKVPPLPPFEEKVWIADQHINWRGFEVDIDLAKSCVRHIEYGRELANAEMQKFTDGVVPSVTKTEQLRKWVNSSCPYGTFLTDCGAETIFIFLKEKKKTIPQHVRKALELRQTFGGSATAKFNSMLNLANPEDRRVRGDYLYCGAQRSHRWSSKGLQVHNLTKQTLSLKQCPSCGNYSKWDSCQWNHPVVETKKVSWEGEVIEYVVKAVKNASYEQLQSIFGDVPTVLKAMVRSCFVPTKGRDYIVTDYTAIEAVVIACMAGEQWIVDEFRGDARLYERAAEKVCKVPYSEILEYKERTGGHHPSRAIGKVSCLASYYAGGFGAWCNFGAEDFLTEQEIRDGIKATRDSIPNIVAYWAKLENAAVSALSSPGNYYDVPPSGVKFLFQGGNLYCFTPDGGFITYHTASLEWEYQMSRDGWDVYNEWKKNGEHPMTLGFLIGVKTDREAKQVIAEHYPKKDASGNAELKAKICYYGAQKGGWVKLDTYGGKLSENITQSVARAIMANAIVNLHESIYDVCLHTHDEPIAEVDEGKGSIEEYEKIVSTLPSWAVMSDGSPWPVFAKGGWRAKRYKKDD